MGRAEVFIRGKARPGTRREVCFFCGMEEPYSPSLLTPLAGCPRGRRKKKSLSKVYKSRVRAT